MEKDTYMACKKALQLLDKANMILSQHPIDRTDLVLMIAALHSIVDYQDRLNKE